MYVCYAHTKYMYVCVCIYIYIYTHRHMYIFEEITLIIAQILSDITVGIYIHCIIKNKFKIKIKISVYFENYIKPINTLCM